MYGERHMQNSCEVFQPGAVHRTIVYGRTRDQAIAQLGEIAQDCVVTKTKRVRRGLPASWKRVDRWRDEYGDEHTSHSAPRR